jgi:hypothetical protein
MTPKKRIGRDSTATVKIFDRQSKIFSVMRDKSIGSSAYIKFLDMFLNKEMNFELLQISPGKINTESMAEISDLEEKIIQKLYEDSLDYIAFSLLLKEFQLLLLKPESFHKKRKKKKRPS